jgi:carbonic anhydrase
VVVHGAACTFLTLPRLTRVLASVPAEAVVTVDISVHYLDHAAHQAISDWQRQHEATGGTVRLRGLPETGYLADGRMPESIESESPGAAA